MSGDPISSRSRTLLRAGAAIGLLAASLGACSRDRAADTGAITREELAAFAAPGDSSLTPDQVDRYLRTTLTQVQLVRSEAPAERERLAAIRRERKPAAPARPGAPKPKSPQAVWGDFVDATFVRSARKLGYNPAELVYVRYRVSVVGGHLLASGMHRSKHQAASLFRQQAAAMRGQPGVTRAQIDAMLLAAEQAEKQDAAPPTPPRVAQNLDALRRARGRLSDASWGRIARVAAGAGLTDLAGTTAAQMEVRLHELAILHEHAVANREPPAK